MNYKWLYNRFVSLLISPSKAWKSISKEDSNIDVQLSYVYPILGLCALIGFLSSFFVNLGEKITPYEIFQKAIITACCTSIPLFAIFFITIFILQKIIPSLFKIKVDKHTINTIVGYSMSVMFLSYMLLAFNWDFQILIWLMQIYTIFIVWEGCSCLLNLEDNQKLILSVIIFGLLTIGGGFIYLIFSILI